MRSRYIQSHNGRCPGDVRQNSRSLKGLLIFRSRRRHGSPRAAPAQDRKTATVLQARQPRHRRRLRDAGSSGCGNRECRYGYVIFVRACLRQHVRKFPSSKSSGTTGVGEETMRSLLIAISALLTEFRRVSAPCPGRPGALGCERSRGTAYGGR
jgi:hypothetical protein